MKVSIIEARKRLSELIRAAQAGAEVEITRRGKVVVQLRPVPKATERRKAVLGGMRGRIKLMPGWDDPIDEDIFLAGDF